MARYRKGPSVRLADLRQAPGNAAVNVEVAAEPEEEEVSYRDLQEQAKAAGIPANQSADDLRKALGR